MEKQQEPTEAQIVDELLGILRKHDVSEYRSASFMVKLAPMPPMHWALATAPTEAEVPMRTELPLPAVGAVEPMRYDLDDVLHGAK